MPVRRWQTAFWLGKVLCPSQPFLGSFQGGRMEVHPDEIASAQAFYLGFYEREVTLWCKELLRDDPPDLIVDVGANFGYYPLLFALLSQNRTKAIAFEADPANFGWLTRNIELNPELRITAVNQAVGNQDEGTLTFETAKAGHSLWSRVPRPGLVNEHGSDLVDVPVTKLDSYLDRNAIDSVPLTLIDVEGFEGEVLRGMREGLKNHRYKRLMVEIHPWAFASPEAIAAMAQSVIDAGYRGYRFHHYSPPVPDKDLVYYQPRGQQEILRPMTFDNLSSWEHYLFEAAEL